MGALHIDSLCVIIMLIPVKCLQRFNPYLSVKL